MEVSILRGTPVLLISLCLCCSASARPATDDDVEAYVDEYSSVTEETLDTCAAFDSARDQNRCIAVRMSHWEKTWHDSHSVEWSGRQTAILKQRISDIDNDFRAKQDDINKEKKEDERRKPKALGDN